LDDAWSNPLHSNGPVRSVDDAQQFETTFYSQDYSL